MGPNLLGELVPPSLKELRVKAQYAYTDVYFETRDDIRMKVNALRDLPRFTRLAMKTWVELQEFKWGTPRYVTLVSRLNLFEALIELELMRIASQHKEESPFIHIVLGDVVYVVSSALMIKGCTPIFLISYPWNRKTVVKEFCQ